MLRKGSADYAHLQAPFPAGVILASVGASMPKVAFSSLCCSREYQKSEGHRVFLEAYARAREWVRSAPVGGDRGGGSSVLSRCAVGAAQRCDRPLSGAGMFGGRHRNSSDLYEQALNVFQAAGEMHGATAMKK